MIKSICILKGVEIRFAGDTETTKDMKILCVTMENGFKHLLDMRNNRNIIEDYVILDIKDTIYLYEDSEIGTKWI